jgi:hypothetical protein
MKIEFITSEMYNNQLNKHNPVDISYDFTRRIAESFIEKNKIKIEQIIQFIPQITGHKWREDKIKVYIVNWKGPSFSNPLTLKLCKDKKLMLAVLAHELLHNNLPKHVGSQEIEDEINNYVEMVFDKLQIDITEQIAVMRIPKSEVEKRNKLHR